MTNTKAFYEEMVISVRFDQICPWFSVHGYLLVKNWLNAKATHFLGGCIESIKCPLFHSWGIYLGILHTKACM